MKGISTVTSLISGSRNPDPFLFGKTRLCHTTLRFQESFKLVFVNNEELLVKITLVLAEYMAEESNQLYYSISNTYI